MTDPKWGTKRTCQSCGANFYDLRRDPITCPKCEEVFEPKPHKKGRRRVAKMAPEARNPKATEDFPVLETDGDNVDEVADEDEDLIEDASVLGKDDEDVAEVMEGVVNEDKADI